MKALIYPYQGEEFEGDIEPDPVTCLRAEIFSVLSDSGMVYLRGKDVRAIITGLREDAPEVDDPTSSDDALQQSEPPEESSAPTDT